MTKTTATTNTAAAGNQGADTSKTDFNSAEQRRRLETQLVEKILGRGPALPTLVGDFNFGPKSPEDEKGLVLVITDGEPELTPEARERLLRMFKEMPPVDLNCVFISDIHGNRQWPAHCLPAKRDVDSYFEPETQTLHLKDNGQEAGLADLSLLLGHPSGYVGYAGSHLDRLRDMVRGERPTFIWPSEMSGSMGNEATHEHGHDRFGRSDK